MGKIKDCENCKYAEWDYETYYGTNARQWFVCGCKRDEPEDDICENFEEEMGEYE